MLAKHLKKMEDNITIDYKILKFVKVPIPRYGVVLIVCPPNSIDQKTPYEVSILDYPSYSCLDFKFMKSREN